MSTLPGKNYAEITFDDIKLSGNNIDTVTIECFESTTESKTEEPCNFEMGKTYKINITDYAIYYKFKATDGSGYTTSCRFSIRVKGIFAINCEYFENDNIHNNVCQFLSY